ncbi:MAG: hypothetical protein K0S68_1157 [Candidatus Saccharibacteria bacterium]|nr:hypothetical protein [Candidatus Saccharibacteria bacterium]
MGKGKVTALVAGAAGITLVAIPLTRHTIIETGKWVAGFAVDGWQALANHRLAAAQMRSLNTMLRGHPEADLFDRLVAGSNLPPAVIAIMQRMRERDLVKQAELAARGKSDDRPVVTTEAL